MLIVLVLMWLGRRMFTDGAFVIVVGVLVMGMPIVEEIGVIAVDDYSMPTLRRVLVDMALMCVVFSGSAHYEPPKLLTTHHYMRINACQSGRHLSGVAGH